MKIKLFVMLLALSMAAMTGCGKDKKDDVQEDIKIEEQDAVEESADAAAEDSENDDEEAPIAPVLEESIFDENGNVKEDVGLYEPEDPEDDFASKSTQTSDSATSPKPTTKPTTKPSETPTPSPMPTPTLPPAGSDEVDYEAFQAMSPAQQQAHMESFADLDQFFDWYNAQKEQYEKEHPSIEVDGGSIDLDKIVNGN